MESAAPAATRCAMRLVPILLLYVMLLTLAACPKQAAENDADGNVTVNTIQPPPATPDEMVADAGDGATLADAGAPDANAEPVTPEPNQVEGRWFALYGRTVN